MYLDQHIIMYDVQLMLMLEGIEVPDIVDPDVSLSAKTRTSIHVFMTP